MNILITGTTGFLGKVFLLDVLDKHNNMINKIYLLIREKYNLSPEKRFKKMINNPFLKEKFLPYLDKISVIGGSLEYKNFGIEENILKNLDINIVVNNAASIKFNDTILNAYEKNCQTLINLLECSINHFTNLHKMIHISTFYVNFPKGINNNIIIDYKNIIKDIQNGLEINDINKKYNFYFENSYVITKFLSEKIFNEYKKNFDAHIIRPSIISNSYEFPFPGWTDSTDAYIGFNLSYGTGIINYVKGDPNLGSYDNKLNVIPVDYVTKIMRETIFNNCEKKIINADINNKESLSFGKLKNTLNYYNILNYKAKYIVIHRSVFWFFNFLFDYIFYALMYYFLLLFDYEINFYGIRVNSKKMNFICKNVSNINDISFYIIHNEWKSNAENKNLDMEYYHNIIIPQGNNKYILKKNLNEYSLIKKNNYYNDINWLYNKCRGEIYNDSIAIVLRNTFKTMFSDIFIDIEKLIDIIYKNKEENLIICPNHRSYCDFLLMSYIFYELKSLGVKLPLVAATSDFKKVPIIGTLFEKLGCFYIERGKGKDPELNKKIKSFVENGENIEFFIEGTRSRTRQILPFKTGLIKCLQETGKSFKILPVTFSYEKIPEQEGFLKEIITGEKLKMKIKGLFLWAGKRLLKKKNYGNVYVKFSELIKLENNSNANEICKKICKEYQINSVITNYHFKFPIHKNIDIKDSGLCNTNHSNILEEWICMNQWIFKYITRKQSTNFWENEYFDLYNYLEEEDKIINKNNIKYHQKYFKYINKDIQEILEQLNNSSIDKIDIKRLVLGNIVLIFVKKVLEKHKMIDNNLNVDLEKIEEITKSKKITSFEVTSFEDSVNTNIKSKRNFEVSY